MEYFTALLIWIAAAQGDQHAARPHCEALGEMFDTATKRGESLWKLCEADKACAKVAQDNEDAIDDMCP